VADRADRRGIAATMQAGLGRAVPALGGGLAAFYAALAAYWVATLRPAYPLLGGAWAGSALLLAALALAGKRLPPWARRRLPDLMAAVALADSLLLLGVTRDPALSIALYITVLGFGLVLMSRLSLLLVIGVALGGWGMVAATSPGPGWSARGIALSACCVAAFAAQAVRIRLYTRLEEGRRREVAAIQEAEAARRVQSEMETKSAFIRLAAHELATPLTAVTIQARALAKADLPGPLARSAALLERNVRRLNRLMRDVLVVTQYQAGVVVPSPCAVDLGALVRERVTLAARQDGSAEAVVEEAGPVTVEADRDRLGDAIARLLENAARYGGGKPPVVAVRREGGEAVVEVRDFGRGIPPERVEALFRPFSVDPNKVTDGGAGLGLAIARLHVEAQGGRIGYAPADPGAAFSIRLPLSKDA
jgi:signal transduction histidine kinase